MYGKPQSGQKRNFNDVIGSLQLAQLLRKAVPHKKQNCDRGDANSFIFYGKGGEVATNRLEDQELSILALHLLPIYLVYINTLMIQQVLSQPQWMKL